MKIDFESQDFWKKLFVIGVILLVAGVILMMVAAWLVGILVTQQK